LWWADYRGASAIFFVSGFIIVCNRIFRSVSVFAVIAVGCVFLGVASLVMFRASNSIATDQSIFSRRQDSDTERQTMLEDAWQGFLAKPWVGHGSWQHARSFISSFRSGEDFYVGVHNVWLQLAYEYGLFGLIVGGFVWIRLIQASLILVTTNWAAMPEELLRVYPCAFLVALTICYDWIFAPFGGIDRIYFGMSFGFCLYVVAIAKPKVRREATLPRSLETGHTARKSRSAR
jgi:O-antigen ligase